MRDEENLFIKDLPSTPKVGTKCSIVVYGINRKNGTINDPRQINTRHGKP